MARRFHQVPTHIGTPEPVLSMGPLTLSARQFLLLLLGGALSYHSWQLLGVWTTPAGALPRLVLALLPAVGAGALAFVRLADRPLEHWLLCLLRFWTMSRLLLWRSVRRSPEHLLPVLEDAVETPSPRTC